MKIKNQLEFTKIEEFRLWLENFGQIETECWLRVSRSKNPVEWVISYLDAVEEALCVGWIDSTLKKLDEGLPFNRFSPRKKSSNWTELNKERARRLIKMGRRKEAGGSILPDLKAEYCIPEWIEKILKNDEQVWKNMQKQPILYRNIRISNIDFYQKNKQPETAEKQLKKYIENTKKWLIYGDWNDNGRLL